MMVSVAFLCEGRGFGSRSSSTPQAKIRGPWLAALRPHHPRDFTACPPSLPRFATRQAVRRGLTAALI